MKQTKEQKVLELLRQYGSEGLTPKEAYFEAGTMRLSSIIFNLKKKGHIIRAKREGDSGYARYFLDGEIERG